MQDHVARLSYRFHDTSGSWEKPSRNSHMEGRSSRNSAKFESFRGIRKRSSASQGHGFGHGPGSRDSRLRIPSRHILTFGTISRAEHLITRRSTSPKETRKPTQPKLTPEIVVYISGVSLIKGLRYCTSFFYTLAARLTKTRTLRVPRSETIRAVHQLLHFWARWLLKNWAVIHFEGWLGAIGQRPRARPRSKKGTWGRTAPPEVGPQYGPAAIPPMAAPGFAGEIHMRNARVQVCPAIGPCISWGFVAQGRLQGNKPTHSFNLLAHHSSLNTTSCPMSHRKTHLLAEKLPQKSKQTPSSRRLTRNRLLMRLEPGRSICATGTRAGRTNPGTHAAARVDSRHGRLACPTARLVFPGSLHGQGIAAARWWSRTPSTSDVSVTDRLTG